MADCILLLKRRIQSKLQDLTLRKASLKINTRVPPASSTGSDVQKPVDIDLFQLSDRADPNTFRILDIAKQNAKRPIVVCTEEPQTESQKRSRRMPRQIDNDHKPFIEQFSEPLKKLTPPFFNARFYNNRTLEQTKRDRTATVPCLRI